MFAKTIKCPSLELDLFIDSQGFTRAFDLITDIAYYKDGKPDGGIENPQQYTVEELKMLLACCQITGRTYLFNTGYPRVLPFPATKRTGVERD